MAEQDLDVHPSPDWRAMWGWSRILELGELELGEQMGDGLGHLRRLGRRLTGVELRGGTRVPSGYRMQAPSAQLKALSGRLEPPSGRWMTPAMRSPWRLDRS
jgi:hypothetical protein